MNHTIQFGEKNREFDYRKEGGQNILFPNWRLNVGTKFLKHHRIEFIYQPIFVKMRSLITDDFNMDDVAFNKNQGVETNYDFPFYRLFYTYDFFKDKKLSFELGAGLQIRNANITFESLTGDKIFATRSLGPVPLIIFAYEQEFKNGVGLFADALGFWAPIKYLNGGRTDIEGWIYESSMRVSYKIKKHFYPYLSTRLIGGGNKGSSDKTRTSGGRYSKNILNTLSLNFGLSIRY